EREPTGRGLEGGDRRFESRPHLYDRQGIPGRPGKEVERLHGRSGMAEEAGGDRGQWPDRGQDTQPDPRADGLLRGEVVSVARAAPLFGMAGTSPPPAANAISWLKGAPAEGWRFAGPVE